MHRRSIALCAVLALAVVPACQSQQYSGTGIYAFAIDENTPPFTTNMEGDQSAYWVEQRIELPIRQPEDGEWDRGVPPGVTLPMGWDHMPWVRRADLGIEIQITISDLQPADPASPDATDRITLTVNGINEFSEYVPGIEEDSQGDLQMHFSQWERVFDIPRGARRTFTLREEELDEIMVDLATVVNGAPNPNEIVYFANHSAHDPRAAPYIPSVIPGLIGIRVGLVTNGPMRAVAETSIRLRNLGDLRKIAEDNEPLFWLVTAPAPVPFVTTDMMPAMM